MKRTNPFLIKGYISPAYFCDRETETKKLLEAMLSGRDVTLFSLRRMGKTGLLHHLAYHIGKKHSIKFIYTDIFSTENLNELVLKLGNTLLQQYASPKTMMKWVGDVFKSIRPLISYDPVTGAPELSVELMSEKQGLKTLDDIFNYVTRQKQKFVWAIDEFQQVAQYPEKKTEAILRTYIQQAGNVSFIFSGSRKDMLFSIFNDAKRPFYQSTQLMELHEIDEKPYQKFIIKHFASGGKKITEPALQLIFEFSMNHTWYIQLLCNRLYFIPETTVKEEQVREALDSILRDFEPVYYNYRTMQTPLQWRLLKAIAYEGRVLSHNSKAFINRYQLGTAASVNRALQSLIEQEHISRINKSLNESYFRMNDVFLMHWIRNIK